MAQASFIFITGGVRSGKSSLAEKIAIEMAKERGGQLIYLATGAPSDPEMRERIGFHQQDRALSPYPWKTLERTVQIGTISKEINEQDIVLLDCVTTLLNNELFSIQQQWDHSFLEKVKEQIQLGIISIKSRAKAIIVVSNEVLQQPLPETEIVFTYGRLLGQLHQFLVKEADQAILVEAGIPMVMKGMSR